MDVCIYLQNIQESRSTAYKINMYIQLTLLYILGNFYDLKFVKKFFSIPERLQSVGRKMSGEARGVYLFIHEHAESRNLTPSTI